MDQRTGIAAISAMVLAVGSFILTFSGHPVLGLIASIVAVPLASVGLAVAASPRVGGGFLSIGALALAVVAGVFAILGIIGAMIV